ncbi:cytochrome-c peroxidase [Flavobacterium sp. HJJ]|uniref:cytochrome-c peroxidase n=1 Tax=Flavobacterium sp. HJJ TaxID=2783792 RepID=UPI00188A5CDD|nr:cytochrome c peroxidase [Flavobacterium sp. HJJ]MBF4471803.1 cytochrome-c peroxidase [Flavobacterium sp. HJJ]
MKQSILILGLLLTAILLGAASNQGSEYIAIPTDPYEFVYPTNFGNKITIPADNLTTKEGVYLGRMLFYETRLSSNNKVSCATCHQQKLAFTDGKQFSLGVDNVPTDRNSMSLANLLWVNNFFWDGRAKDLEEQANGPLTNPHEMGNSVNEAVKKLEKTKNYPRLFKLVFGTNEITSDRIQKAIAQFERTLISANSRYDQYLSETYLPTEQEQNGMDLFMTSPNPEKNIRGADCAHCHGTPKMYKELFHNNGLDIEPKDIGREKQTGLPNDKGRFRVVTLRNIALTAPYMHDGRFQTLEEVLDHYNEHIQSSKTLSTFLQDRSNNPNGKNLGLTAEEKKNIIHFLKMLTDSTFITNRDFSDPKNIKNK